MGSKLLLVAHICVFTFCVLSKPLLAVEPSGSNSRREVNCTAFYIEKELGLNTNPTTVSVKCLLSPQIFVFFLHFFSVFGLVKINLQVVFGYFMTKKLFSDLNFENVFLCSFFYGFLWFFCWFFCMLFFSCENFKCNRPVFNISIMIRIISGVF